MIVHKLLFLTFVVTYAAAKIDCSVEDTCFGEPLNCDENTNCTTLFHFDPNGNLNLYVRNFTNPYGYVAFAFNHLPDEIIEYFVCLPPQGHRLRGIAELGGLVLLTEQNLTNVVEPLASDYFRCFFNASEIPKSFHEQQVFFVTKGTFDDTFIIFDGEQLYNLEHQDDDFEEFYEEDLFQTIDSSGSHVSFDSSGSREPIRNVGDMKLEKLARSPRGISFMEAESEFEEQENENMGDVELEHIYNSGNYENSAKGQIRADGKDKEMKEEHPRVKRESRLRDHEGWNDLEDEEDNFLRSNKIVRYTAPYDKKGYRKNIYIEDQEKDQNGDTSNFNPSKNFGFDFEVILIVGILNFVF